MIMIQDCSKMIILMFDIGQAHLID